MEDRLFAIPEFGRERITPYLRRDLYWTEEYRGWRVQVGLRTSGTLYVSVREANAPIAEPLRLELLPLPGREQHFPTVRNKLGLPGAYGFVVDESRLSTTVQAAADAMIADVVQGQEARRA